MKNTVTLRQIEGLLRTNRVEIALEDDRNPVVIAASLSLVELVELERVETGFFNGADQRRMITDGRIIVPIAFGQCVLQAVIPEDQA